jgi:DNA-binding NtrC family response regulator
MASMLQAGIEVESEPGKGSRFSLTVSAGKLQAAPNGAAPRTPADPAPRRAEPSTILLVEDHPAVRSAMELFFKAQGYHIVSAESFDQTLKVIGKSPRPELLITDFHLPGGKTGSDVIHSVRGVLGKDFPAIMISGDTSDEVSALAHDAQVRFATKPIDPASLVDLVQELLQAG